MSDKVEAIQQAKEIQEVAKQEQKREEAKEKAEAQAAAKPAEKKAEASKKEEPKKKLLLDRVFVIPLYDAYKKSRSHRARRAMSLLKEFICKHAKVTVENVRVSTEINSFVLTRGARNPAKKVRVRVEKDDAGMARVSLVLDEAVRKKAVEKAATKKASKEARRAASKAASRPAAKPAKAKAPADTKPVSKPAAAKAVVAPKASTA